MAAKRFNVAIIGYGFSAKIFHIPFIQLVDSLNLYGIVQRNPSQSSDAAKDFPQLKVWKSSGEMLSDAAVDLAIITTPVMSHVGLAKACLEAGKHVVVEKPFTATEQEARYLADLARQHGKILTVYQNRRLDADYVTVAELLSRGRLGRIVEFETHIDRYIPDNPSTWREQSQPGVGQLYDTGSHLIDQVVNLFGMPEKVVSAVVKNQRADGDTKNDPGDYFTAMFEYKDGLLVTLKATVLSAEVEQLRFWVRGDKGSFKKYHFDCQEEQLLSGIRPGERGFGVEPEDRYGTLTTMNNGQLVKERYPTTSPPTWLEYYRRLGRAMAGEASVDVTADQAADVIKLIELVRESSVTGRSVRL